ncbi:hypothetical protein G9A89_021137 [Geosiphon pyriformis]|nr:hypothetical protein G9A89_021137 [Geosiphon pyriformis]
MHHDLLLPATLGNGENKDLHLAIKLHKSFLENGGNEHNNDFAVRLFQNGWF